MFSGRTRTRIMFITPMTGKKAFLTHLCLLIFLAQHAFLQYSAKDEIQWNTCNVKDFEHTFGTDSQISPKNHWNNVKDFEYITEAPLGPMETWPTQGSRFLEPKSISTCIPGLAATAKHQLQSVLSSSSSQTALAAEIVAVVSDVLGEIATEVNGTAWCAKLWKFLAGTSKSKLRLVCVGERLTAGRARNIAAHMSRGNIISFIDADDHELPTRNEVITKAFTCDKELKLLLHGFSKVLQKSTNYSFRSKCQEWTKSHVSGSQLYEQLEKTHSRWWLLPSIAHGHMVVHRDVFRGVRFTSLAKGQDSVFIRDALFMYGRSNKTSTFIPLPLTTYIKSNHANKDLLS